LRVAPPRTGQRQCVDCTCVTVSWMGTVAWRQCMDVLCSHVPKNRHQKRPQARNSHRLSCEARVGQLQKTRAGRPRSTTAQQGGVVLTGPHGREVQLLSWSSGTSSCTSHESLPNEWHTHHTRPQEPPPLCAAWLERRTRDPQRSTVVAAGALLHNLLTKSADLFVKVAATIPGQLSQ
jgi:hypothetical protein